MKINYLSPLLTYRQGPIYCAFLTALIGWGALLLSANSAYGQKSGKAEYLITIEAGKSKKQAEMVNTLPEMLKVRNSMYFYKGKGIYVQSSDKALEEVPEKAKTYIWKSGKNSFKYEALDTNCCILYSQLKDRYTIEQTSVVEEIAGYKAKKVILFDQVNNIQYLVWYTSKIKGGLSPIGVLPVKGFVLRLKNENIVYEVKSVEEMDLDGEQFEVSEDYLKFSEKAFRRGYIP